MLCSKSRERNTCINGTSQIDTSFLCRILAHNKNCLTRFQDLMDKITQFVVIISESIGPQWYHLPSSQCFATDMVY